MSAKMPKYAELSQCIKDIEKNERDIQTNDTESEKAGREHDALKASIEKKEKELNGISDQKPGEEAIKVNASIIALGEESQKLTKLKEDIDSYHKEIKNLEKLHEQKRKGIMLLNNTKKSTTFSLPSKPDILPRNCKKDTPALFVVPLITPS